MDASVPASTAVWLGCGFAILAAGGLVRRRGRVDLLAHADAAAPDPAAAVVGILVLAAGAVVVGYGLFELYAGFSPFALALCVALVVALSVAAALRARGG